VPREKVSPPGREREVVYTEDRWKLLAEKRRVASKLMEALARHGLASIVHGSVARGDVGPQSDVDVFVPYPAPSFKVELALEEAGFAALQKKIVQATPRHAPKAYLVLEPSEKVVVSFPLAKLTPRELEFYYFGGAVGLEELKSGVRKPGINKRLELIVPTPRGHYERSILGYEAEAAKIVGVSLETVMERVRVLTRRDEVGRTGVFVEKALPPDASFEEELERLRKENPAVRRVLEERGA